MSQAATRKDIDEVLEVIGTLVDNVDKRFVGLESSIDKRFDEVDKKFGTIDRRFDIIESRFDSFEAKNYKRFDDLEAKFDKLLNTVDAFVARIDKYETELAARDHQFEKLLSWARKVSVKTGIPLENL